MRITASVCLTGLFLFLALQVPAAAQELAVNPVDVRIEQRGDGGYHLFIRAKPGMGSVLLTESTKDPAGKADNYAYRAEAWNPVNGDEKRLLNGAFIPSSQKIYSLIDSTPEPDTQFGKAFHVFIPWVVAWGYSWGRNGRTYLADGTYINIRAFAKPYADYSGGFAENPYEISVTQRPFERTQPVFAPIAPTVATPPSPQAKPETQKAPERDMSMYMPETVQAFSAVATVGKGTTEFSVGKDDIVAVLGRILDAIQGTELDLVICLDTTDSMADDIDAIKASLPVMIREKTARFKHFRLGLVLYKDYFEDYVVQTTPFTVDPGIFETAVSRVRVRGGRDIPEAVYEALYEALTAYDWSASARLVVLIGDAPPHPIPRATIDRAMVEKASASLAVAISVIILPH